MNIRHLLPPALLACLLVAGCAGGPSGDGAPGNGDMARAVEPSLRAAAAAAEAGGDFKGAAQHWRTLYQHNPDDKMVAELLARALRLSGSGQQGADVMQTTLARTGRDGGLLAELGKDYLAADRLGLAAKSLVEAATLAPLRWDVPSALGIVYDMQGKSTEAAAAYAQALAMSPDNPEVLNNLGLSQALAGKLDAAIATLRHADEQPASGAQVRQNLALLLALKGDPAAAERLARHDLTPDMARANTEIFRSLAQNARQ